MIGASGSSVSRALGVSLAIWVAGSTLGQAQLPEAFRDQPVARIEIEGEASASIDARDVGIPIGARLSRMLIRTTIERLLATGRWADVQIDAEPESGGIVLHLHLRPRIVLARIETTGNAVIDTASLLSAMGIASGSEIEPADVERLTQSARDAYAQRGYTDAQIELQLRDTDDPARKLMRIHIDERLPRRVSEVRFEGETPPSTANLPGEIGIGVGSVLDLRALGEGVRHAQEQLRTRGWLESEIGEPRIEADGERTILVVPLVLGPRYEVRILGNQPVERERVEAVLQLNEERLTPAGLDAMRERVLDVFQRHGFHHAAVRLRRARGEVPGTAVLAIAIRPGPQLRVVGFSFPGATHFTSDHLRNQLASVLEEDLPDTRLFAPVDSDTADRLGISGRAQQQRRFIPAPLDVDPGRVWYEPLYTQALDHLRELYEADGYLEARVGPPTLREVEQNRGLVAIPIFEGPRTMLHAVHLSGNQLIGDRELLQAAELVRGAPFSHLALEEAETRMTDLYRERGHLYAEIESSVRFSEDHERAEVTLSIVERFPVTVGEIRVEGERHTSEGLVRDVMRLGPGDLLRPSLLRESQERLMGIGIFTGVTIEPLDADLPERVKVLVVTVSDRLPQYHEELVGISTGQGIRASAEYGYRNIAGYGIGFTARAQLAFQFLFQDPQLERNFTSLPLQDRLERRITLSLSVPQIGDLDNVRATLDLVDMRDNERFFGLQADSTIVSFIWQPWRRLQVTTSAQLEYNRVQLLNSTQDFEEFRMMISDPRLQRVLRVPAGESGVFSTRLLVSLDERDSPFTPTRGFFGSTSAEYVTTLAAQQQPGEAPFFSNFLKLGLTLNGYVPIGDFVIAGQFRTGGILHLQDGSQTYPNRQYFLGGVDTMRGFNQDQLLPQDLADLTLQQIEIARMNGQPSPLSANSVTRGGDLFMLFRAEVRIPIVESLQAGVFADIGNHWADPATFDFLTLRPTAGLGIRIATPVGPLALDYGFNILRRADLNEPVGAFHFSIGVF